MKNCIILGSGRSGTSMVAGCLANSGYFMGENLLSASASNPKGFFEDIKINLINEELLESAVPKRPNFLGNLLFRHRPLKYQRWLAQVPIGAPIQSNPMIDEKIIKATQRAPYCYKDPRFSYTLSAWQPFLQNIVYICVFRDPGITVESILKECKEDKRLHSLYINRRRALNVWRLMYERILTYPKKISGNWLFLHYNQVVEREGLKKIAEYTEAPVDMSFPEKSLQRSFSHQKVPAHTQRVYHQLCRLANYLPDSAD